MLTISPISFLKKASLVLVLVTVASCKDNKPGPDNPGPSVPTTYNFSNVSYTGQTQRLSMLDSITKYMSTANTGMTLNAITLKNMYANSGNPFNNATLDASGKQLKNKTYAGDQMYFDNLFDSIAANSLAGNKTGSNGVAGLVASTVNPSKKYLFNANGVEYAQVIRKQLMGAVFYYQALETYLAQLATKDNNTIVTGEGTVMEHSCDEAFGYFGVPVDFPTNLTGLRYWGSYANQVNKATSSNANMMNAFLKLRNAISTKDYTTRDAQIIVVREEWEKMVAASAILELTEAKKAFSDDAVRNHYLSEGIGFIHSLKYNTYKKITQSQIDAAVNALGTNLYDISTTKIDNAIGIINGVYGLNLSAF
ncbi:MAG: DUF4856 domain-containing protein [Bacteroidota bacterium]